MRTDEQRWTLAGLSTTVYDSGPPGPPQPVTGGPHGTVVVLVHGGDPRSLAGALDWSTVWRPDVVGARLVAYDKPGQGLTYEPGMAAHLVDATGLTRHLEALLERLRPAPVVLVGHSRGALPVADVALRRPDRVVGLVLVASNTLAPHSDRTPTDFYPRAYADPPEEPTEAYVRREPAMNSWSTAHVDELVAGRLRGARSHSWWEDRPWREEVYRTAVQPSLVELRSSVLDRLVRDGVPVPVLQTWGQEDVSAPVELGHALFGVLAAGARPCTGVVVNHCGHYVYRERPGTFLSALASFVAGLPDATGTTGRAPGVAATLTP